jgi:A/G-specific adenine glycosylase
MDPNTAEAFWRALSEHYAAHGRHDMAWRLPGPDGRYDPYRILISEIMLQQTQVARVTPKFHDFIAAFPDVLALAAAPLGDVLKLWSGLGYNRRAKYLWQAARAAVDNYGGQFPRTLDGLQRLPGVGPNTAGAVMAYAYDQPVVYVETNIRTVIIHHFFADQTDVPDSAIKDVMAELVTKSVAMSSGADGLTPREFYWAMMDYGTFLKKTVGNLNRASRSYTRQSAFQGSLRQLRGAVMRLLSERAYDRAQLVAALADERSAEVLLALTAEGLVVRDGEVVRLA